MVLKITEHKKYSYTGNTTTNSQNNNKLTQIHSGGGYACNLLENGSFEYNKNGWSEEGWGADWVSKDTSYVEEDSYFGRKCLKKVVQDANDCKILTANTLTILLIIWRVHLPYQHI